MPGALPPGRTGTAPATRDLGPTLDGLLAAAMRAFDADAAAIYLADPHEGDLVLEAARGLPPEALGHRLAVGEGLVGRAASVGRSIVSDDVPLDPRSVRRRPDWEAPPAVRAFLGVALHAGPTVLGVLELVRRRAAPFTPEERGHASIFADGAALLIEQTRLMRQPPPAAVAGSAGVVGDPIGVASVNRRLLIASASPAFCEMLGQPVEGLVGRPVLSVLPALGHPHARDALEAALRGSPSHLSGIRMPSSTPAPEHEAAFSLALIPVGDASRGGEGVLLALQDVSARARLEAELRSQTANALDARDRLRAVVEVVSHELRTPLTSVLGYARLLQDRPDAEPDRRAEWAALVAEKARLMARQVEEVTELARLGSTAFALERRATDLGELVRSVAAELSAAAPAHTVVASVAPGVPSILADRDRIGQVVSNLVGNAIKFWPAGGTIRVFVQAHGGMVDVAVVDQGPGIPAGAGERVFDPFFRVRSAETAGVKGTGLGLSICRAIVAAHGGDIAYEPTPGGGATFRVRLPLVSLP